MRYDALGGLTIGQFGRVLAPVNLSARQAKELGLLTSGICGPHSTISSDSANLQSSLASRLQVLLNGSDLCEVIWKPRVTPWGASLSKPRARVRTIFATDSSLWPTATSRDHKDGPYCPNVPINALLGRAVWVWPTPLRYDADIKNLSDTRRPSLLSVAMRSTPRSSDGSSESTAKRGALNPEFVCWLMGFPQEWVYCGVSAMLSIPARRRRS
jgi:hypothetical protein